jgi:hypothetical protein
MQVFSNTNSKAYGALLGFAALLVIGGFAFFAFSPKAFASAPAAGTVTASCICQGMTTQITANTDADGTYFLGSDNQTIYVISQGTRRPFASPWELSTYTSQPISQIVAMSAALPNLAADRALPLGTIMRAKAGLIIQDPVTHEYFLTMAGGGKAPFVSANSFRDSVYKSLSVNIFDTTYYARGPLAVVQ